MHEFVVFLLPYRPVARHAEQFASQMSCLLLPKATFEAGLRSCPVSRRFAQLGQASPGEYDAQSSIALLFGGSNHEATAEQRFEYPHESRSVHYHRFSQLDHRQFRTTTQRAENAELRGRDADLGQMTLVKLRDVSSGLADGEAVVALK
jgi:hypothetical protein